MCVFLCISATKTLRFCLFHLFRQYLAPWRLSLGTPLRIWRQKSRCCCMQSFCATLYRGPWRPHERVACFHLKEFCLRLAPTLANPELSVTIVTQDPSWCFEETYRGENSLCYHLPRYLERFLWTGLVSRLACLWQYHRLWPDLGQGRSCTEASKSPLSSQLFTDLWLL